MKLRGSKPWGMLAVYAALLSRGTAGCSGGDQASGVAASKLPQAPAESLAHEACSESGNRVEVVDANGDGKPDVKRVYDRATGKEICRITDLNHDGKADLYEYFDSNGVIRRREADYDDNGVIDSIEYYEDGKLVRREYDTTGQHRIDTWDFFDKDTGRHTRRERDINNDGRIDQWWTWDGDKVTVASDRNGDGRPDPETALVLVATPDGGLGPPVVPDSGSTTFAPGATDVPSAPTSDAASPTELRQPPPAGNATLDAGATTGEASLPLDRKDS
jgi:hypothetical protein